MQNADFSNSWSEKNFLLLLFVLLLVLRLIRWRGVFIFSYLHLEHDSIELKPTVSIDFLWITLFFLRFCFLCDFFFFG